MKGLLGPAKRRIPVRHRLPSETCDQCWSAVADLMSVGNCDSDLEKAGILSMSLLCPGRSRDHILHSAESRRNCVYRSFPYKKTVSAYSSGEKGIAAFYLSFVIQKSTNVVNSTSKVIRLRQ